MNILFANKTSCHCGCVLTSQLIIDNLSKYGNLSQILPLTDAGSWRKTDLSYIDIVVINGEGTFHHDSKGAGAIYNLAKKAKDKNLRTCLINTVIEAVSFDLSIFDYISCRESISANGIFDVTPDMCFPHEIENNNADDETVLFTDGLNPQSSEMYKNYNNSKKQFVFFNKTTSFKDMMELYNKSKLIVTGRYHGVIFSLMRNKPFYCTVSNSHKIQGLLKDFGLSNRLVKILPDKLDLTPPNIDIDPIKVNIKKMFDKCFTFPSQTGPFLEA